MSGWNEWPSHRPKRPPPEGGIKVKKIGATWWGQRWTDALERMSSWYSSRLPRGRTYARAGRVHELEIAAGAVIAKVTGTRTKPYEIHLTLTPFGDRVWRDAIAAMAARAQFAADLLGGEMPREIDAAFASAGATLFPASEKDLVTACSCPDWANPCKHVAATHYVLGEAFDRDPFLLFELRGRTRAQVLDALRASRTRDVPRPAAPPRVIAPARPEALEAWRADPPALRPTAPAATSAAALQQLGPPPAWTLDEDPATLLQPLLAAAAARAREIALGSPETPVVRSKHDAEAPGNVRRPRGAPRQRRR